MGRLPQTAQAAIPTIKDGLRAHVDTLALKAGAARVSAPAYRAALLGLHLVGLLMVARLAHWPWWAVPALLAGFSLLALVRRPWRPEALAPLGWLYALAAVRVLWVYALRQPVPPALGYPWGLAFCAGWALLIALRAVGRLWLTGVLVGVAAALLFAWQLWRLAPAGVTGADPFTYVQMALDLATHGSPLHQFPLAVLTARLGLPTLPATHVGYVLPNAAGWAPTVWPAGYSALLAGAYRLGGERLLLGANAWVGLASLAATALLAAQLVPPGRYRWPLAAGGAAAAVLATSPEQWVRLAVPLADGAAQLFTTLAVAVGLAVLADARRATLQGKTAAGWGAVLGLVLGAAFSVRYTQALVAPGLALVVLWRVRGARPRWAFAAGLAVVGLLAAAPDLFYRTGLYGAPWRFGTGELALFSVEAVPGAVRQLLAELLRPAEFGWLWPLALVGAAYAWHHHRAALGLLAAAYLPPLLFHLWYPFVRLRDVLFGLAPLAALAVLGGGALAGWLWRRGTGARLAVVAGLLVLGLGRAAPLLARAPGFFTFGALQPEQRAALASLAALTEPDAVIAASLNSGAIELYSGRLSVRPGRLLQPQAAWSAEHWLAFAAALRAEGRPLYVLMDSPELDAPLAELQSRYALAHVALLPVPVFGHTGGSENMTVVLWKVEW